MIQPHKKNYKFSFNGMERKGEKRNWWLQSGIKGEPLLSDKADYDMGRRRGHF